MTASATKSKEWLPAVLSVASVIGTGGYAVTRQSQAAAGIQSLLNTGSTLSTAASVAQGGVVSQQDTEALDKSFQELDQRMKDSRQPGLVQAQLVEFARSLELEVREVQPIVGAGGKKGQASIYPAYRVAVAGKYAPIAEYMNALPKQRIPGRIIGLRLGAQRDDTTGATIGLTADMMVEVFQQVDPQSMSAAQPATEAEG